MTAYDDHEASCVMCSRGLPFHALCDCDEDPCCIRCHRVHHVAQGRRVWEGTA